MTFVNRYSLIALLLISAVPALWAQTVPTRDSQEPAAKISIIIERQLLRFVTQGEAQEWRLEVLNQQGEVVFDSGPVSSTTLEWPLKNPQGEAVASGLYAYRLTLTGPAGGEARAQRGYLILERAGESSDHVWVTSESGAGIGSDIPGVKLKVVGGRETSLGGAELPVLVTRPEQEAEQGKEAKRAATAKATGEKPTTPAATTAGTSNQLAKFASDGTTLVNSTVTETASGDIGIGTPPAGVTFPGGVLDLVRNNPGGDILQRLWNTAPGTNAAAGVKLRYVAATGATSQLQLTDNNEWLMAIAGNNQIGMQFRVRNTTDPNTEAGLQAAAKMTIRRNGNVGIGTPNPLAQLEVQTNNPLAEALFAQHASANGVGLSGVANVGANSMGVSGRSIEGYGVYGSSNTGANGVGVYGTGFIGVDGVGGIYGVRGVGNLGVWGRGTSGSGVYGISSAPNGPGVHGISDSGPGVIGGPGVLGHSNSGNGVTGESGSSIGVYGVSQSNTGTNPGIYGETLSTDPAGIGVFGLSNKGRGVQGNSNDNGTGVYGYSYKGSAVYGTTDLGWQSGGWAGYFNGDAKVTGTLFVDGYICAFNVQNCPYASDLRLKQGVTNLSYGLPEVLLLRPVSWTWKDKRNSQVNLGLIAQEVEPLIPELVITGKDAEQTKELYYIGLLPVVIKAIQEQQTTITTLKAENTGLKRQNVALEKRNAAFEARLMALEQMMQEFKEQRAKAQGEDLHRPR